MTAGTPDGRRRAALLEQHYLGFDRAAHIGRDPVQFPRRYRDRADIEVAAFFAASLAFGRVAAFGPVIDGVLAALGPHPASLAREAASLGRRHPVLDRAVTSGYRWLQPDEIRALLLVLGETLIEHGSLEQAFAAGAEGDQTDTWDALGAFLDRLRVRAAQHHPRAEARSRALAFLFPSVRGTAPCKRQHLFLRWMVRSADDGVDFGLWSSVEAANLVVPCDVHVARIGHALGMASRPEPSRSVANEITAALRQIDPHDPIRFDFALSHLGISLGCRAKPIETVCGPCTLRPACRWWEGSRALPLPREPTDPGGSAADQSGPDPRRKPA